jgi:hypothetical protein
LRQNNIDEQKRRAEQGLSNTLAFEEKALKDAEARKAEEEKKAVKREKTLTFFKLLAANAEKDPNTALTKTITEILLADTIAGAFKDGVEDFKGKGTETSDSNVVLLSNRESVVTAKGTKENKGLVTAMNEGFVEDYFRENFLPKYIINEPLPVQGMAENLYGSMQLQQLVGMNKRLESLEDTIRNKPVTSINIDQLGRVIETTVKNGLLKTTIKPLTNGY